MPCTYSSTDGRTVNIGPYSIRASGTWFPARVPELDDEVGNLLSVEDDEVPVIVAEIKPHVPQTMRITEVVTKVK